MYRHALLVFLVVCSLFALLCRAQEDSFPDFSTQDIDNFNLSRNTDLYEQDDDTETSDSTKPVNEDINNSKDLFTTEPLVTDISDTVQVKLYCEISKEFCKKVEYSLVLAARSFAQVVNLKAKIVFQASYYSFCENACSNTTYGWGTPSSQFVLISLEEADANFIYPQALAKQLTLMTDTAKWANYDVAIDINHDMYMNEVHLDQIPDSYHWNGTGVPPAGGYYFASEGVPIADYQVDLHHIILHQMIHGLGMVSSWAPYFSDTNSPFQKLLKGLIPIDDSLKLMTPSPDWYITHTTGPTYITGFQPNMIFDKFLDLTISARNETVWLGDYGFEFQGFCLTKDQAFIYNFMNSFLNNATQSSKAKSIYVAMAEPNTLTFDFNTTCVNSTFCTNDYLKSTYQNIKLMTGPNVLQDNTLTEEALYRPGISTSHVDDSYNSTPDFLMVRSFPKGKTLQTQVDENYANIPDIYYNATNIIFVNVTTLQNVTEGNRTVLKNVTTSEQRVQTVTQLYKSPIGPGILRILETLGYSSVLTDTNYTKGVVKTSKPNTTCDDNSNNFLARSDSSSSSSSSLSTHLSPSTFMYFYHCIVFISALVTFFVV